VDSPLPPGEGWVRARFDVISLLPSPRFARPLPEGEGCPHLNIAHLFIGHYTNEAPPQTAEHVNFDDFKT